MCWKWSFSLVLRLYMLYHVYLLLKSTSKNGFYLPTINKDDNNFISNQILSISFLENDKLGCFTLQYFWLTVNNKTVLKLSSNRIFICNTSFLSEWWTSSIKFISTTSHKNHELVKTCQEWFLLFNALTLASIGLP